MTWHDDVSAALPPVEPDDPVDLRCELVDEIADHLSCAMERELRRDSDGDEEAARGRVLKRFGDVRSVLRRLWWDSLWERLVTQRITLAAALVLAVASLVMCGLVWSMANSIHEANQEMLARSEETSRKLLDLLAERPAVAPVPAAPAVPASPEWNPLSVELVAVGSDEPLEGWTVEVSGHLHTEGEESSVREKSDEQGITDLGIVRPGRHRLQVQSPWGESSTVSVTVRPGLAKSLRIVCPKAAVPEATVEIEFDVPRWDVLRESYGVLVSLGHRSREIAGVPWRDGRDETLMLLPDGTIQRYEHFSRSQRIDQVELYGEPTALENGRLSLPIGTYEIENVKIVALTPGLPGGIQRTLEVVAPSSRMERFSRMGIADILTSPGTSPEPLVLEAGNDVTPWTIPIPRHIAAVAWSTAVAENAEVSSNSSDFLNLVRFFHADENLDGGLSADEYDDAFASPRSPKPSEKVRAEWPLEVQTFLDENKRIKREEFEARRGEAG